MNVADKTIGEIVANDYRTVTVFENHGIDFCCGGKVPLATICTRKGLDLDTITRALEAVKSEPLERSQNYSAWELAFLADFIINIHHAYLKENIGQIVTYAHKIADVHGARHSEVIRIAAIFDKIATDMAAHLKEEEDIFFPAVKRAEARRKAGAVPAPEDLETIAASLKKLSHEHEEVGDAIHAIRQLANSFEVPSDACNTYMVTYQKLKEFEEDLHKHVHLENNILFPKAAQL